jgi:hypothetical protein
MTTRTRTHLPMVILKWLTLLIGLAVALLLGVVAAHDFMMARSSEQSYYVNVWLYRGTVLSCVATAIGLVAAAFFLQLPRLPKLDRAALSLLVVSIITGVAPFAYAHVVKEVCLNGHHPWNVTQMKCEQ